MNNAPASSHSDIKTKPRAQASAWRRISLSLKMPTIVLTLLALAFAVSTYLSVSATQAALVETLESELGTRSNLYAETIRSQLMFAKGTALDLATVAESFPNDKEAVTSAVKGTLAHNEHIFGSAIAYEPYQFQTGIYYWAPYYSRSTDGSGFLNFTQLGSPQYDYFKKDWYTQPKAKRSAVLSPLYFDEGGGNIWMVTWSAPFYNTKTREFKGVTTADVDFTRIQKIISEISVGKNGYAFLLDKEGVILGIGNAGGFYTPMESSMLTIARENQTADWENLVKKMTSGETGFVNAIDAQGRPMYVSYAPVGMETGWSLALAFPQSELAEKTSKARNTLVLYGIGVALIFGIIIALFTLPITLPLRRLTRHAKELSTKKLELVEGKLIEPIQIHTRDELEELAEAFNQMAANVSSAFELLEEKVAERTSKVERSTLEFSITAEIARDINIIRDLDTLLNVSVNLIRERFNYYHVGVFMLDDHGEYAVLRAASSIAAQQMLDQNYRLKIGQGLVGNVIRTGEAHIALDVGKDAVHFQNPFLPETHSEIALPLRSRSVTIGALDIQTTAESAFAERDVKILQLLADLLAGAIENAELSEQVKNTLSELNTTYQSKSREVWETDIQQREHPAYEYDGLQVRQAESRLPGDLLQKLESGKPIIVKETGVGQRAAKKTLMVPIKIADQVIGVIGLEQDHPNQTWTEEEIALVQAAANRAAITLENARLLEESQRRAVKERAIFEATARIGSALNIENILYTTAEEIERAVNSAEVILQFTSDAKK